MSRALLLFHLGKQLFIHIRAFFYRSAHEISAFPQHNTLFEDGLFILMTGPLLTTAISLISSVVRAGATPANDGFVGRLALLARLASLGQNAGRAARIAAAGRAPFAATHGMTHRVHGGAAIVGSASLPAL